MVHQKLHVSLNLSRSPCLEFFWDAFLESPFLFQGLESVRLTEKISVLPSRKVSNLPFNTTTFTHLVDEFGERHCESKAS